MDGASAICSCVFPLLSVVPAARATAHLTATFTPLAPMGAHITGRCHVDQDAKLRASPTRNPNTYTDHTRSTLARAGASGCVGATPPESPAELTHDVGG